MPETDANIRILIADDHLVIREGLKLLLESYLDLEIVGTAKNGQEAIVQTSLLRPDIVIIDFHMPLMNGPEAVVEIRSTNPDVRFIMMSGNPEDGDADKALAAGASAFLTKVSPIEELVQAIRNAHARSPEQDRRS